MSKIEQGEIALIVLLALASVWLVPLFPSQ